MIKSTSIIALIFSVVLVLTGCGGGGSSSSGTPAASSGLEGVVAVGAPVEADIVVIDANGNEVTGRSNAAGEYTLNTTGLTAPFMIRATADDGRVMYSYAAANQLVANVTPLTSYIVNQVAIENALSGGSSQLFSEFSANSSLSDDVTAQVVLLNALIASLMEAEGVGDFDHFSDVFDANHAGYDAFLDALDIEIESDEIVIRVGSSVLDTLSYDITDGDLVVSGQILNASTQTGIAGATLSFANDSGVVTATTDADGRYSATLENFRSYDVTISATGFSTIVYNNVSTFALSEISTAMVTMITTETTGDGTVTGTVINARTAEVIAGVSIELRDGINNRDGSVVATGSTDVSGNYSISVVTGVYTAEYSLDGFTTTYATVVSLGGQSTDNDVSLVAETAAGTNNDGAFATIVLSWGQDPDDLDTFLTGPSTVLGDRFKLAYYQQIFTTDGTYNDSYTVTGFDEANPCATPEVVASIDLDDVTEYGPETTTICRVENGEYRYYVHHYSGTSTITDSPAQVVVTTASGVTRTFIAPPGATGDEDIWHVFNLDSHGNIIPVNTYSNGEDNVLSAPLNRGMVDEGLIDNSYTK